MPLIAPKPQEEAPTAPHLGLLTNEYGAPTTLPIPPGSILIIIEDPKDPRRGMFPVALVKVSHKRIDFQCPCGQDNCTRRAVFHATWTGKHPTGTPEISMR